MCINVTDENNLDKFNSSCNKVVGLFGILLIGVVIALK